MQKQKETKTTTRMAHRKGEEKKLDKYQLKLRIITVRENFSILLCQKTWRIVVFVTAHTINSWLLFRIRYTSRCLLSVVARKGIKTKSRNEIIFIKAKIIYILYSWTDKRKFLWSCRSDDYSYILFSIYWKFRGCWVACQIKMTSTASPLFNFYQCSIYVPLTNSRDSFKQSIRPFHRLENSSDHNIWGIWMVERKKRL